MCIFCKIIAKEIPAHIVYEDDSVLAFLDIKPVNPGHVLVIPKTHYQNIEEAPENVLCNLMKVVKKIGKDVKEKLNYAAYNVMENNDPLAGQLIPHLHFHIIPRQEGDGHRHFTQKEYADGEALEILNKLKNQL